MDEADIADLVLELVPTPHARQWQPCPWLWYARNRIVIPGLAIGGSPSQRAAEPEGALATFVPLVEACLLVEAFFERLLTRWLACCQAHS